ncbi:hypothetical protein ACFLUT_01545 [Chloroflexota bacterium]
MALFKTIEAVRVVFVSGLAVLVLAFLIMASCRCLPAKGPVATIRRAPWFSKFFSRHCMMWFVFVVALAIHVVFASGFIGFPF